MDYFDELRNGSSDPCSHCFIKRNGVNMRIAIRSHIRQSTTGLDDEDKFLAKHTFHEINSWSGDEKKLWLWAIKTARLAQLLETMGDEGPTDGC